MKEDREFTFYRLEERNRSAWGESNEGRDSASNRTAERLVKNYCWSYHQDCKTNHWGEGFEMKESFELRLKAKKVSFFIDMRRSILMIDLGYLGEEGMIVNVKLQVLVRSGLVDAKGVYVCSCVTG